MIELRCVSSEPVRNFEWMKGNFSAVNIYKLSKDNSSLYIPDAVFEDCGHYVCTAEKDGDVHRAEYELIIDGEFGHGFLKCLIMTSRSSSGLSSQSHI